MERVPRYTPEQAVAASVGKEIENLGRKGISEFLPMTGRPCMGPWRGSSIT